MFYPTFVDSQDSENRTILSGLYKRPCPARSLSGISFVRGLPTQGQHLELSFNNQEKEVVAVNAWYLRVRLRQVEFDGSLSFRPIRVKCLASRQKA
jgi:hypothetical protein